MLISPSFLDKTQYYKIKILFSRKYNVDLNSFVFSNSKNLKIKLYEIIRPVVLYGYGTWSLT